MRIIGTPKDAKVLKENERRAIEQRNKLNYERMAESTPPANPSAEETKEEGEKETKPSKNKRSKKKV